MHDREVERVGEVDEARDLLRRRGRSSRPRRSTGSLARIATGQPSRRARPVTAERPLNRPISNHDPRSTMRFDDRADLVDLAPVARDRGRERRVAAFAGRRRPGARGGSSSHRRREVREEAPRARERVGLGLHLVVDGAVAGVNRAAAERLLVDVLAELRDDRRARDEQLRCALDHHAVVARDDTRRAESGDGAEAQRDDGHRGEVRPPRAPNRD